MKDFIYDNNVRIFYGAGQMENVVQEIAKLGKRLLVVPTGSFAAGGHYEKLERALTGAGLQITCLSAGKQPLLSKVNEGIRLCTEREIQVVLGIGGGVSMDLAKAIAFGALHTDVSMEKFLTYTVPTGGAFHAPGGHCSDQPDVRLGDQCGCADHAG